jgi:hypothetical protein
LAISFDKATTDASLLVDGVPVIELRTNVNGIRNRPNVDFALSNNAGAVSGEARENEFLFDELYAFDFAYTSVDLASYGVAKPSTTSSLTATTATTKATPKPTTSTSTPTATMATSGGATTTTTTTTTNGDSFTSFLAGVKEVMMNNQIGFQLGITAAVIVLVFIVVVVAALFHRQFVSLLYSLLYALAFCKSPMRFKGFQSSKKQATNDKGETTLDEQQQQQLQPTDEEQPTPSSSTIVDSSSTRVAAYVRSFVFFFFFFLFSFIFLSWLLRASTQLFRPLSNSETDAASSTKTQSGANNQYSSLPASAL